jgi:hypothetical protein
MGRVFISYRHVGPDQGLAAHLAQALKAGGCDVFWDTDIQVGQRWAAVIEQELRASRFFVVLVSAESMRSDMVGREVRLAHELSRRPTEPVVLLPIRVAYTAALPYDLAGCLDPVQYTVWESDADTARVTTQIMAAIGKAEPLPQRTQHSDDAVQGLFDATEKRGAPLPAAELRFETGTVRLDSRFYLARPEDQFVLDQVRAPGGVTVIIKGVRQIGKSSLLARAAAAARQAGGRVLYLDFQLLGAGQLQDLDSLLRWMARRLYSELRPTTKPQDLWSADDGPKTNLSNYLEDVVLKPEPQPLVLLLDEVDRIFEQAAYRDDFFSLVRYWHNLRATRPEPWDRLNLVIAHSTEPSLWIQDLQQSPFNVGERFHLRDFTAAQVAELNRRYGEPLPAGDLPRLLALVGGHPFLLRQALFCLARHGWAFAELERQAADSDGPFGDHLKRYLFGLSRDTALCGSFKAILRSGACADESHFQRLSAVGLITGSDRASASARCQLYADYFRKHL